MLSRVAGGQTVLDSRQWTANMLLLDLIMLMLLFYYFEVGFVCLPAFLILTSYTTKFKCDRDPRLRARRTRSEKCVLTAGGASLSRSLSSFETFFASVAARTC